MLIVLNNNLKTLLRLYYGTERTNILQLIKRLIDKLLMKFSGSNAFAKISNF